MKKYKKLIITILFILCVFSLSGCGNVTSKEPDEENTVLDVDIIDVSNRYYNDQTILIPLNNGFRCIGAIKDFNDELQEYTITIKIAQPIKK